MNMRTAAARPVAWNIFCPYCGEPITQNGSQMIDPEYAVSNKIFVCNACGKSSKIPKTVEKAMY